MISESYDDPEEYGGPREPGPGSLSHDRTVEAAIDFVDHNGLSFLKPAPSTTTPSPAPPHPRRRPPSHPQIGRQPRARPARAGRARASPHPA